MITLDKVKIEYYKNAPSEWLKQNSRIADKLTLQLLYNRNIHNSRDIKKFLKPSAKNIPSPRKLPGAYKASKEILEYIKDGKKIFIHGDFDADGITATAILWESLFRDLNANVIPYIPNRVDEGYGLSEKSIETMISRGAEVIITVDCGIRDSEIIKRYIKKGIKFIVTDHHKYPENFDPNQPYTIVHPDLPNKSYVYPKISGATVAFLLKEMILQEAGLSKKITDTSKGLDLAGISVVTDIMPLIGVNRDIVYLSLKQIKEGNRVGLQSLVKVCNISPTQLSSYHYGFVIGPRLNASGRIGNPMDAVKLLVTNSSNDANILAERLNIWNTERQQITESLFESAIEKYEKDRNEELIFIKGEDWAEGIIGLVASKMQDRYNRPTIVVSMSEKECRGSCRSINGIDITNALTVNKEYLTKFGGHSMAAGFSVEKKNLEKFENSIKKHIKNLMKDIDLRKVIKVDTVLSINQINLDTWYSIVKLEPFGLENTRPLIYLKDVKIIKIEKVGRKKEFVKLIVKDDSPNSLIVMLFDTKSIDIDSWKVGDKLDIVGYIDVNIWKTSVTIQFVAKYIKKS